MSCSRNFLSRRTSSSSSFRAICSRSSGTRTTPCGSKAPSGAFTGSVALFEFEPMGSTLHAAEDLLSAVRATDHVIGRDAVTALMDCIGASEAWIASIERTGGLPDDAEDRARKVADALRRALEG